MLAHIFILIHFLSLGEEKILAKVGSYLITEEDFKSVYRKKEGVNIDSLKRVTLDNLIKDKLFLIDAYNKNYRGEIDDQLKEYENRLIVGELYNLVVKRAKIDLWKVRQDWWKEGLKVKCSRITVKDKNKLKEVYKKLRKGENFSDVARQYSEDYTAKYGGDLGEVTPGQFEPKLSRAIFSLREGQISSPISTKDGYHIIKVNKRIKYEKPDISIDLENRKKRVEGESIRKLADGYLNHLRNIAHIRYDTVIISKILRNPDEVPDKLKNKIIMKWAGGYFTVDEFLTKFASYIKMGRLASVEAVKSQLSNWLTFDILLPMEARRHQLHRNNKIKEDLKRREEAILIREYRKKEIEEKVQVSEEDAKTYWKENKNKYGKVEYDKIKGRVKWDLEKELRDKLEKEITERLWNEVQPEIFYDKLISIPE